MSATSALTLRSASLFLIYALQPAGSMKIPSATSELMTSDVHALGWDETEATTDCDDGETSHCDAVEDGCAGLEAFAVVARIVTVGYVPRSGTSSDDMSPASVTIAIPDM